MKQKALRAGDAHSHEDEECRKRPRSARECALAHSFLSYSFQTADRICQICYNEVYDYSRLRLFRPAIRCAARTRIHS